MKRARESNLSSTEYLKEAAGIKGILMRKLVAVVMFVFLLGLLARAVESSAAESPPPEGGVLPQIKLPVPQKPEEVRYLGINRTHDFLIPQIQAKIVILEVFNMYCPFCQKEAPTVNALYDIIAGREDLRNQIKIIGIGAGNSPFEVETFRKRFNVPFPLFPDTDYAVHEALGRVGTPYFIGIRVNADGSHQVLYSKRGGFGESQTFLDLILNKSQTQKGE